MNSNQPNPIDHMIDEAPDEPQPVRREWQARVRLITHDLIYLSARTEFHFAGPSLVVELVISRETDKENQFRSLPYYAVTTTERVMRFFVTGERFRSACENGEETPDAIAADAVAQLAGIVLNVRRDDVTVACPDDDDEIPF